MTTAPELTREQAEIKKLVGAWADAVRVKDVRGAMRHYAPDVLTFDVVGQLRQTGIDGATRRITEWFASFDGPIGYEVRDFSATAGEDVAFATSVNRVVGTLKDGTDVDMWVRATICFARIDGEWRITHQHISVPFDPDSGQASLDATPARAGAPHSADR